MPRTARASVGGMTYHALNRGNRRAEVFHKPADYDAFVAALAEAGRRVPMDVFGYCLMPNHFHLVVRTRSDGDLGNWMRWLLTTHAQRYHRQTDHGPAQSKTARRCRRQNLWRPVPRPQIFVRGVIHHW